MITEWEEFLDPYIQAVGELKIKLRGIRKQYRKQNRHSPIEFVTGRVKPIESIKEKMVRRGITYDTLEQDLQDIAGLRVMVQFVDDVNEVVSILRKRQDMRVVQERDYITHRKTSGYRSYHVVIEYTVDTINGAKTILVEIQIRTLAMNFWATIEHSLNYKYQGDFPEEIKERLEISARISHQLDEEMSNTGKRVDLIANRKPQSRKVLYELKDRLKKHNFILNDKNPDIVISIGGDGMLLSAFHKYEDQLDKVRFVGVHTGHLGFYTDYRDFELDQLVTNLQLDTGAKVSYPLLNVKIYLENGEVKIFRALNEASIRRADRTMVADVVINHVPFERFRGDGLTVSTPTGSTAYNKSLGGAVLHPTIEALQLAEIASLNNRIYRTLGSSIIVPKKDKIELIPTRNDYHTISIDNSIYSFRNIEKIEYQIDHHKIHFVATPSHTSFWNRVKDAFIGEVDE